MWIKVAVEIPVAFFTLVGGSSFWSLVRLPELLRETMTTPSNLDLLQIVSIVRRVAAMPIEETAYGHASLLFADVSSSLSAWRMTKFIAFAFCLVMFVLSFWLGVWYLAVTVAVFLLARLMEIQSSAQSNVFRDVQAMLGRIENWIETNPEDCKKYCLETNPKYFREMYLSVERRKL